MSGAKILFILTGSIACHKAGEAISRLGQRGYRVRTVATKAALHFIGTAALEGLSGEQTATDIFAPGGALEHIHLARWADLTLVCPATAHTINRMAAGLADDLAGALLLAHDWSKPLLLAPAMNPTMWSHPATMASVARLKSWGARLVDVGVGATACGEVGPGRLAEPERIVTAVESALARPTRRLRVLVTSGGTSEPIDAVRVITNLSTGATGARMADHFTRCGHAVMLLRARGARPAEEPTREETFVTFADLDAALTRLLETGEYDAVIHAAAVGDFSVEAVVIDGIHHLPGAGKLDSGLGAAPVLQLRRNPKLLDTLRARSRHRAMRVVAFKLTQGADEPTARAAVTELLKHAAADFVVHNDLSTRGTGEDAFPADIWRPDGSVAVRCRNRPELAAALEQLLQEDPGPASEGILPPRNDGGVGASLLPPGS